MMKYAIVDTETTIFEKGHPYSKCNKLVVTGVKLGTNHRYSLFWGEEETKDAFKNHIDSTYTLVGSNFKFDIGWLRNAGVEIFPEIKIWDIQLAFFMLQAQRRVMPSVDEMAEHYGVEKKLPFIKEKYWDKGIDTDQIPRDELEQYLKQDLDSTEQIFLKQVEEFKQYPKLLQLFKIHCKDQVVLEEIQRNGLYYNKDKAEKAKIGIEEKIEKIKGELASFVPGIPVNWNSGDHLSCILFGGTIQHDIRVPNGVFKTGQKIGELKYKIVVKDYTLPGLVKPKSKWALQKEGYYSSKESVLRQIKHPAAKLLLDHAGLTKVHEYFVKIPQLIEEKAWENDIVHGTINQTVAVTGRTSASNPNTQNLCPEILEFFEARNGVFLSCDAKALEWVAVNFLSQDPVGMQEIREGVDQHTLNQKAFGLPSRLISKVFVFRLIYGGTEFSYAQDPDFAEVNKSSKEWAEVIEVFYDKYKGIAKWHKEIFQTAMRDGKLVMPTGRIYTFEPYLKKGEMEWPRTTILNYPVQGLGADLMAIIRVLVWRKIQHLDYTKLCSTVHDDIKVDTNFSTLVAKAYHEAFEETPKAFENSFGIPFNLPLRCELKIGTNLLHMKEYN